MNDEVRNGENQFYRCTFAAILTRKKHWENYFFPRSIWIWFRFLHFILRLIRKSFDLASIVFFIFLSCSLEQGLRYRARDQNCRGKCDERMKCMKKNSRTALTIGPYDDIEFVDRNWRERGIRHFLSSFFFFRFDGRKENVTWFDLNYLFIVSLFYNFEKIFKLTIILWFICTTEVIICKRKRKKMTLFLIIL